MNQITTPPAAVAAQKCPVPYQIIRKYEGKGTAADFVSRLIRAHMTTTQETKTSEATAA